MEKVQLKVYLPKNLAAKFREFIMKKYSKYERGLLSYEVEMALRSWLALHTNAQNSIEARRPNPTPKVYLVFAQVKDYLLRNWYEEICSGQQIPRIHLEKAIKAVRGSDRRTVRKWLKEFAEMGLIKMVTSATFEIM